MKNDFLYVVITYAAALERAIATEMRADPTVFHMGTLQPPSLLSEFGPERVRRTPISEAAMTGAAIGVAGCGMRPVVNWRCVTFTFVAFDQIVNQVARLHHRSGGRVRMPLTIRIPYGGGIGAVEHHSESPEAYFEATPGLRVLTCSTAQDVCCLLTQLKRTKLSVPVFILLHMHCCG